MSVAFYHRYLVVDPEYLQNESHKHGRWFVWANETEFKQFYINTNC